MGSAGLEGLFCPICQGLFLFQKGSYGLVFVGFPKQPDWEAAKQHKFLCDQV